jgi:CBS domain-containing protein
LVNEVMTTDVVTVDGSTPYKEIAKTLTAHAISAAPVVDGDGRLIGVVSEADLLRELQSRRPESRSNQRARTRATAATANDLMSSPPIVVSPTASVAAAARLMDAEGVKRLPVVDAGGSLIGVLSRRDLLRIYLRDDWEIREEIVTTVLISALWTDPSTITVAVDRGVVTLGGTAEDHIMGPLLVRMVGSVAGVVDVISQVEV